MKREDGWGRLETFSFRVPVSAIVFNVAAY
jgi:hypothetical protein